MAGDEYVFLPSCESVSTNGDVVRLYPENFELFKDIKKETAKRFMCSKKPEVC